MYVCVCVVYLTGEKAGGRMCLCCVCEFKHIEKGIECYTLKQ